MHCFEFAYRRGDLVKPANRSTIAQYCLVELKGYTRAMGWGD